MNEQYYHSADHFGFQNMIGFNYSFPVEAAWDYAQICNMAASQFYHVVAILPDGVVYEHIIQTEQP